MASTRPEHRRGKTKSEIRAERRARSQSRRRRRQFFIYIAVFLLAGVLIVSLFAGTGLEQIRLGGGGDRGPGPVAEAPHDGIQHIPPGTYNTAGYSTVPATSGPHWATPPVQAAPYGAPVNWGVYDVVLPDEALVHNLEHGGIGLHYDCPDGCPEIVEQLTSLVPGNPAFFVVSPYPGMETPIAVTAWRRVLHLEEFDRELIQEFIRAYIDRAPESVPQNPW